MYVRFAKISFRYNLSSTDLTLDVSRVNVCTLESSKSFYRQLCTSSESDKYSNARTIVLVELFLLPR